MKTLTNPLHEDARRRCGSTPMQRSMSLAFDPSQFDKKDDEEKKPVKCEVDPEKDCAWTLIYQQLEKEGKLSKMKEYQPPKNWNPVLKPGRLVIEREKGGE